MTDRSEGTRTPPDDSRTVHLTDPRAMRALAHPTRLQLLGELRTRGPQTVGMLSEIVDEAVGSVSYHLGKLASFGFVEEVPELARDRRERWWRAAHERTTFKPVEVLDNPERRAALDSFRRSVLRRYVEVLERYLESEATLAPAWVAGATSSDTQVHLTSDELMELQADLKALGDRWEARGVAGRAGTEPVTLMFHAFRRPE
ncbi:winged helix-turn-helix domain-containing protein [Polymorphospora rubra]|nr:helix-turn-helix domain-containing protein [Polymorphospora rubra]